MAKPITAAQPGDNPPQQVTGTQTEGVQVPPVATVVPQQPPVNPPPATPQPPPPAGQPAGIPPEENYERKFKGLQVVHQNLTERHTELEVVHGTLSTQATGLQTSLEAAQGKLDALKAEKGESDKAVALAQGELADFRLWERKLNAIRAQAQHLMPFEKNIVVSVPTELENLDPVAMTEDQLKALDETIRVAIAEFDQAMGAYIKDTRATQRVGEVPPASPGRGSGEPTMQQLYDLAVDKAGTPEGDKIMAQYTKLAEKDPNIGRPDGDGHWRPPS